MSVTVGRVKELRAPEPDLDIRTESDVQRIGEVLL